MTIFEAPSYRTFIRDYWAKQKNRGRGEVNKLAKHIGVHPSLVSQILAESKHFSLEQAQLACEYLDFTIQETEYFLLLVQFERAGTTKLKSYFEQKLRDLRQVAGEIKQTVRQDRELSEVEKAIFYSHWSYAATWLLTSLGDGQTVENVAEWLEVRRERANEVLKFLAEVRLCVLENGRYKMGPQSVHLERGSPFLQRHHTNWRLRAVEHADQISEHELMYTAPISISRKDFIEVRARLLEVVKDVTDTAIRSDAEDLACFNIDLFWIRK